MMLHIKQFYADCRNRKRHGAGGLGIMRSAGLLPAAVVLLPTLSAAALPPARETRSDVSIARAAVRARATRAFARLPLAFEANRGQADGSVRYLAHGEGYTVFLTDHKVVTSYAVGRPDPHGVVPCRALACALVGARPNAHCAGEEVQGGKTSYFVGNSPRCWCPNIASYHRVRYREVYPGIDLVFYGNRRRLEYDFMVAPAARPQRIAWEITCARSERIDTRGDLLLTSGNGAVRWRRPIAYQVVGGRRRQVAAGFRLLGPHRVGFTLGRYDRTHTLVIDPVLVFSTYLAGSNMDAATSVAVDSSNHAYLCGWTSSNDFPAHVNTYTQTLVFPAAFVMKMDYFGKGPIYSAFLSGNDHSTQAFAIAVDSNDSAYVTGTTNSRTFPVSASAFQGKYLSASGTSAFVSKFNLNGNGLIYSTYLGGAGQNFGYGIAVDPSDACVVVGGTTAVDFPTTPGAYETTAPNGGIGNGFVSKISPDGSFLIYSTYLGGNNESLCRSVAVDIYGQAYVTGSTAASNFPTTSGVVEPTPGPAYNAFAAALNQKGTNLLYSTYLGSPTSGGTYGQGIAVDTAGNTYVVGSTLAWDYPTTPNAVQPKVPKKGASRASAFLTKLSTGATAYAYSTYLAGRYDDVAMSVAVDAYGSAYVAGFTDSDNFPVTTDGVQRVGGGIQQGANFDFIDAFLVKVNPAGTALLYGTYLGGTGGGPTNATGDDRANGIAIDPIGNVYLAGQTDSSNFPTTPGVFGRVGKVNGDQMDGFAARFLIYSPTAILWTRTDGKADIFTINNSRAIVSRVYGPYAGLTPVGISIGPDSHIRLLWSHTSGAISLFNIRPDGTHTHRQYGPFTGWTCVALSTSFDNTDHLLWQHAADNTASLWNIDPSGTLTTYNYGPFPGWSPVALSNGPDDLTRVLWDNPNGGQFSLWWVDPSGQFTQQSWAAVTGWTALSITTGSDGNTRVLYYDGPDNDTFVWVVSQGGSVQKYIPPGPGVGWKALSVAVGEENSTRVLWTHTSDGKAWDVVIDAFANVTHTAYGPYAGWTAKQIVAGY